MTLRGLAAPGGGSSGPGRKVIVVVSEPDPGTRHFVITAYLARKLAEGEVGWSRS
jgi:hypothetical protein